jgi:hypothetical protein
VRSLRPIWRGEGATAALGLLYESPLPDRLTVVGALDIPAPPDLVQSAVS